MRFINFLNLINNEFSINASLHKKFLKCLDMCVDIISKEDLKKLSAKHLIHKMLLFGRNCY